VKDIEEILKNHSLSTKDYEHIKNILKREPNIVEIGVFSAMWSEHCSYKSSKIYLKGFPTQAPWVVQGPGENAGVIDIGEGKVAVFKMESHNHPSFIEPYQGAATGVGGILRDIFTMGARPIANLNAIRFAPINKKEFSKKHTFLLKGCVAGIGGYGNCMGIPTIGGETTFEDCYGGNVLVNAFSLGIADKDGVFYAKAEGIGNPIIYAGSKTGRDGLGGAVMSSNSFDDESVSKRPTVQVGDPFVEKLLLEACLEVFSKDLIIGIQDMGAAGLTSSVFEMADKSGSGVRLDLDKVPARETHMTPYDFMLSESQERMLMCAKKGKEKAVIEIFEKWGLSSEVIGEVTDTNKVELYWHGKECASIPVKPITDEAPELNRPIKRPDYLDTIKDINIDLKKYSLSDTFEKMISHIDIADKSFVYEQYDSTVQTNTTDAPGKLDSSVIRIKDTNISIAIALHCSPRACYIDPYQGALLAVAIAGRKVAVKGATPLAITDCLNYGNPEKPEVMWQFKEGCEGIKKACASLNTPVVSGNVSLYNETLDESIYPTPSIGVVGVVKDNTKTLKSYFQHKDSLIAIIGDNTDEMGGSLYLKIIHDIAKGTLPKIDLEKEKRLWRFISDGANSDILTSCKECSSGGIAINIAKMCAVSSIGATTQISLNNPYSIFAESQSRVIVELDKKNKQDIQNLADKYNLTCTFIGQTTNDKFELNDINISLDKLKDLYFNSFNKNIHKAESTH
jgi:phosphoribosylformylglycinamidine synthase